MRNSKHGLKALVMGIMVVLGAMALAAGAQGQTHTELLTAHANHNKSGGTLNPNPLIHGAGSLVGSYLINLGAVLLATVAAVQHGVGILLVAEKSIEVRCTGLELAGAKIDTSTDALGEAKFTGCKTFDHKTLTEITTCLLKELETIKAKALVLPILHGPTKETEEPFLLFEPQNAGESFAIISYKPGIGCVLPLNNPVSGSVVALVHGLDSVKPQILFSHAIQLLIGDLLTFGGSPAFITAEGLLELTGTHLGQKLGIH